MNILIIGGRRVGSLLALELDRAGHEVGILDEDIETMKQLAIFGNYDYDGLASTGIPIDMDVLRNIGIENVDAVACVTADDNVNLMVAQIALNIFKVPRVVCRVAEPSLKNVYSKDFGMRVVCSTNLTMEAVAAGLLDNSDVSTVTLGQNTVGFIKEAATENCIGKIIGNVPPKGQRCLFGLLREGQRMILASHSDAVICKGDILVWAEIGD